MMWYPPVRVDWKDGRGEVGAGGRPALHLPPTRDCELNVHFPAANSGKIRSHLMAACMAWESAEKDARMSRSDGHCRTLR